MSSPHYAIPSEAAIYWIIICVLCLAIAILSCYFSKTKLACKVALADLDKMQKKMIAQDKLITLGTLAAGIAHEIKNPLNFILNFSKLAQEYLIELQAIMQQSSERQQQEAKEITVNLEKNLQKIREHSERANDIVNNMLMYARGEKQKKYPENLSNLINEAVSFSYHSMKALDPNFNVKITKKLDDGVKEVHVISSEIIRVLINLFNNAFYSVQEKKQHVKGYIPEITISTLDCEKYVQICIYDNGGGISEENLESIFTPFFTTKPLGQGTGLGLAISREIITLHHFGTLEVKAKDGEFAEFTITLPKRT